LITSCSTVYDYHRIVVCIQRNKLHSIGK
jgi:hypothetical protein